MYSDQLDVLLDVKYCRDIQDFIDLQLIKSRGDIFVNVQIHVIEDIEKLTEECTARPCFTVRLQVNYHVSSQTVVNYVTSINENMQVAVEYNSKRTRDMCL